MEVEVTVNFAELSDEQLAKHINAAVSELKDRHSKQEKELAAHHGKQIAEALSANGSRKRGPKAKG